MNKSDEAIAHEILQELGTPDLSEEQKVFKKVCAIILHRRQPAAFTNEQIEEVCDNTHHVAVSADAVEVTTIEHCDQQNRDYIPLASGYEWQSKGNGSTIRIVGPNGERHPLSWNPPHVVKLLEDMICAQHTALKERKAYGDACRLDGARKMQEAAAKLSEELPDKWQYAGKRERFDRRQMEDQRSNTAGMIAEYIRALSPETVCGVANENG